MVMRTSRARIVPSRRAPVFIQMRAGWRERWISKSCMRESTSFTGRREARASQAAMEWMFEACLPPKPPPTRVATARIFAIGSTSSSATRCWTWCTDWQVAYSVMRPAASTSATQPFGSM